MSNLKKDIIRLKHILDAIDDLESFTKDLRKEEFLENLSVRLASIKSLEIIGEASRHLSEELTSKYELVPWAKIVAFRNVLVHEYFQIESEIVWNVIRGELSLIKREIHKILAENE